MTQEEQDIKFMKAAFEEARQAAAEALGLKWYKDSAAVFADPAIDAVYIATNNASHAKLALAALRAVAASFVISAHGRS